ncbi:MAG: 1,2-phenylacetyl-CoA epoxidase subunit B [Robiginitomaculum sp.]|nr:MAG: 1,2-phenylacetyl-CoA epoxidase subunit B [Robiginitomaculum sp.]
MSSDNWHLYEVFMRSKNGLAHKHAGSVHAQDAETAIQSARDLYTRRGEASSLWIVKSNDIIASDPSKSDELFDPADDKIYRHASFYTVPDGVKNM